jgi:hypothetical protein
MELFRNGKLLESRMYDSPLVYQNLSPTGRARISFDLTM